MWKSCSCQHMLKNVFWINQISWVFWSFFFFLYSISHFCFLWNSLVHGFFSIPFFFLRTLKTVFPVTFFCFSHFYQNHLDLEKNQGSCLLDTFLQVCPVHHLPLLPHDYIFCYTPTLLHRDKQAPQQNCDQNQSHCLGESLPHRDTSWQCFPRNLNSRRSRASHRGREIQHQMVARGS